MPDYDQKILRNAYGDRYYLLSCKTIKKLKFFAFRTSVLVEALKRKF